MRIGPPPGDAAPSLRQWLTDLASRAAGIGQVPTVASDRLPPYREGAGNFLAWVPDHPDGPCLVIVTGQGRFRLVPSGPA